MTEEKTCVWNNADNTHSGKIETKILFGDQLSAPMCEKCFKEHGKTMYLSEQKINIDVILKLSLQAKNELYGIYKLVNSEEYKKEQKEKEIKNLTGGLAKVKVNEKGE